MGHSLVKTTPGQRHTGGLGAGWGEVWPARSLGGGWGRWE